MRSWTTAIRIEAPRQRVWETLLDFEKASQWNPSITSAAVEAPGGFGQGTRILAKNGSSQVNMTVEEFTPPRLLGLKVVKGMTTGMSRYTVSSNDDGGTSVEHTLKLEPRGLMLLGQMLVQSRLDRELSCLKEWLEKD